MLTKVAWQTLIVPAWLPLQYAISHGASGFRAFIVAGQYSRALNLWSRQGRLSSLLSQFNACDLILVVQAHTGQYRHSHRCSYRQTAQTAPRSTGRFGWYGLISQSCRNSSGDVQTWKQQLLVHSCPGDLITSPSLTGFYFVDGIQHPTQFQFVRFVIHHRGQRFLQGFTTHGGSSLGCRRCLRFPATTAAGLYRWLPERGKSGSARYPPDTA